MNIKIISIIPLFLLPTISFAFFCPTNFSQVYEGNSIDEVVKQCGKPDKIETKEVKPEGPQEWNYYIPQTVATNMMAPVQGTLKTQMTFDNAGRIINISVNGIGVGATTICGSNVQLGDTRDQVKNACGKPTSVNKQDPESSSVFGPPEPSVIMTEITYSNPPSKLVFMNGKLTTQAK